MQKSYFLLLTLLLMLVLITDFNKPVLACLSITDELNLPNPTIQARFELTPDINPFTACWNGEFRVRSRKKNWRLVATRSGPNPISLTGDSRDNIMARDISFNVKVKHHGMAHPHGAILVPPFHKKTNLEFVHHGTLVASGIKKSGKSCLPHVPHYYSISNRLCLYRDFVFNVGDYEGQVSYLLIAP